MTNTLGLNAAFQHTNYASATRRREASHSVFTSHRVIVPELDYLWSDQIQERLNELTSLPIGWDGYGGRPVSFTCAYFVAIMLERLCQDDVPAPSLVPGNDGSIQVEWHRNNYDVELDVLDVQNVVATRVNLQTDQEEVVEIQNDFSEIMGWISDLADEIPAQNVA